METLPKIAESVIRQINGGKFLYEEIFAFNHLYELIDECRASLIKLQYTKERTINDNWVQSLVIDSVEEKNIDNECFITFNIPPTISLDNKTDGLIWVGDGIRSFRRLETINHLYNSNLHRVSRLRDVSQGGVIKYYCVDGKGYIYGDKNIKEIKVQGIFANPRLLPTYNLELDMYPIDNNILLLMKQEVIKQFLNGQKSN